MASREHHIKGTGYQSPKEGHFTFRTPKAAYALAEHLAEQCKSSHLVSMGLKELFLNAIEHGNLEIGFEEKGRLIQEDIYLEELDTRLQSPPYAQREVLLKVCRMGDSITFKIFDEGKGFDPEPFLQFSLGRISLLHGRGIALANLACFERVSYNRAGNMVQCTTAA